jgi:hypothetical protein
MIKRIIHILIIFFVAFAGAIIGTYVYERYDSDVEKISLDRPALRQGRGFRGQQSFMLNRLNIREEQQQEFFLIRKSFQEDMRALKTEERFLRHDFMQKMLSGDAQHKEYEVLADSIGDIHAKMKIRMLDYYGALKNICDQEQRQELDRMILHLTGDRSHPPSRERGKRRCRNFLNN